MIVSCNVLRKGGKIVVILGDFGDKDLQKSVVCDAQLVTCVEKFKEWNASGTKIEVIVAFAPSLLTDKPNVDQSELQKLAYRIPLWLHGSSDDIRLSCADTRDYFGTEVIADIRSLLDRFQVLEQWINGECKIHNLSKATWAGYISSVRKFVEAHTNKKNPLMVKSLLEAVSEKVSEENIRTHKAFGERKLNLQRQILYHSFKRCKPDNRQAFLVYFRNIDHMLGDILYVKAIHAALASSSKIMFVAKQSHGHTIGQYLKLGEKYESVFDVPHRADNDHVDYKDLGTCLESLKKKKKKKRNKKKNKAAAAEATATSATTSDNKDDAAAADCKAKCCKAVESSNSNGDEKKKEA
mmetsp:Transcript_17122/g.30674  ORF Transcript_17122/g.30674 Transcript_17122/m.30674 type:complete len:353 (+) Transcript_17122:96-1154(+)|eukprot:CAMPEP_0197518158 /NCGR_PEP_ID=MMETSP1318-20131121/3290_1 /TAXON_ID=552666 /ORGANISM="Partenskyella glossopodia, Strain RCC365" /LENGTH=352 /DNA_ID=CAMNT_0043068275 /DNA_START=83 /DNA_END=1141 /DNA_ORIENTATION=+